MGKDYLDDLQEWVKQKKGLNGRSPNSARVVFLALRDDVKSAIDAGYSMVTIWEHMYETGRVTTTYETFRRHVKRYIHERQPTGHIAESIPAQAATRSQEGVEPQEKTTGSQLPVFRFNPGKKERNN